MATSASTGSRSWPSSSPATVNRRARCWPAKLQWARQSPDRESTGTWVVAVRAGEGRGEPHRRTDRRSRSSTSRRRTERRSAPSAGPAPDRARRRPHGRHRRRGTGHPARRRPRLLGRGLPVRPDAVAARVDGVQGHRDRHRGPRRHPGPAVRRPGPRALQRAARPDHRRARDPRTASSPAIRWADGWSPSSPPSGPTARSR